jgi:hypothetical protein
MWTSNSLFSDGTRRPDAKRSSGLAAGTIGGSTVRMVMVSTRVSM